MSIGITNPGKWLGNIIYELDQLGNQITDGFVSQYDGERDETWSSAMGKALAVDLWHHPEKGYEPRLKRKYYIGRFFNWICNLVQKEHSLRSIEWDVGIDIQKDHPGIKAMVESYLLSKGIKDF